MSAKLERTRRRSLLGWNHPMPARIASSLCFVTPQTSRERRRWRGLRLEEHSIAGGRKLQLRSIKYVVCWTEAVSRNLLSTKQSYQLKLGWTRYLDLKLERPQPHLLLGLVRVYPRSYPQVLWAMSFWLLRIPPALICLLDRSWKREHRQEKIGLGVEAAIGDTSRPIWSWFPAKIAALGT